MSKKNLLLIVGAGASVDFGIPSVNEVDKILDKMANEKFKITNHGCTQNLYSFVKNKIENYMNLFVCDRLRPSINFENILYALTAAAASKTKGCFTSTKSAILEICEFPNVFFENAMERNGVDCLDDFVDYSHKEIIRIMREKCKDIKEKKQTEYNNLKEFLMSLNDEFNLNIITLCYDNIMYQALKDIKNDKIITGFNKEGIFDKSLIFNETLDASKIIHLHGSINFSFSEENRKIIWKDNYSNEYIDNTMASGNHSPEGDTFPHSTIIAGYGKTVQMLQYPFRAYYSELERLVHNSDRVLFAGYGFNDTHVNNSFHEYLNISNDKKMVIIDFQKGENHEAAFGLSSDLNIFSKFDEARMCSELPQRTPWKNVKSFYDKKEIQTVYNNKLAVWYNGMQGACEHKEQILANLR